MGFGAWAVGGLNWGPTDDEVSTRAILAALDQGVNFIDTADVYGYGHSEELIAAALKQSKRQGVIVATKAGNDFYNATEADETGYGRIRLNGGRDYIIWAAEQSLRRLGTDVIDILQLHSLKTADLESPEPWEALERLKQQGKIRYAGWSITSFKETEQAHLLERHAGLIDCIQVRYNMLEREAEEKLFPLAQANGIGVIVRIPLLFGFLTGKFTSRSRFSEEDHRSFNLSPGKLEGYLRELKKVEPLYEKYGDLSKTQVSLRFCLSHPACHTVIPGAKTPEQVLENCSVGDMTPLSVV